MSAIGGLLSVGERRGGGIFVDDDANAVLSGTTVSGNGARYGAGIFVDVGADRNATLVCDIGAYEFQLAPPTASITDVTVIEGNSGTVDALFTVTLSRASSGTISFAYATANGTATVVADYQAAAGTVTSVPGDTSETITVRVVGDTVDEPNETFSERQPHRTGRRNHRRRPGNRHHPRRRGPDRDPGTLAHSGPAARHRHR